jgi:hypothetical protein
MKDLLKSLTASARAVEQSVQADEVPKCGGTACHRTVRPSQLNAMFDGRWDAHSERSDD